MKDKKMLEEMAKIIGHCYCDKECQNKCAYCDISSLNEAKKLYENGFRKLPKDSVLLSKEEYEALKKQIEYWEHETKVARQDLFEESKETAEKIFKELKTRLKDCPEVIEEGYNVQNSVDYFEDIIGYDKFCADEIIKELAKKFGVEIKE